MFGVQIPTACTLCPRRCGANRAAAPGACGAGKALKVARAALHFWEEPCISGTRGSGTVFFSGCPLHCGYCQNHRISQEGFGKEISAARLKELFLELQAQGAHNINLVTATQWLPWLLPALQMAKAEGLSIPLVYNTSGYETEETLALLGEWVDIWLADVKYVSSSLSLRLSGAADYFAMAQKAVRTMLHLQPQPLYGPDGLLQKGVILRHLVLPGESQDSKAVLTWMAALPKGSFIPSFMSQFTPFYRAKELGLGRRITTYEYRQVIDTACALDLTEGFMQERSSAKEEYTPPFDLEGV